MATQGGAALAASEIGGHPVSRERRVFTSRVSAVDERPSVSPSARSSSAWGTVRIVVRDDDRFEYLATIYNPTGETFSAAFLRRQGGGDVGAVLATLFSDLTLRTPYIQLRGTVSVARDAQASLLAEELRENPRAFSVTFHTAAAPSVAAIWGTVE